MALIAQRSCCLRSHPWATMWQSAQLLLTTNGYLSYFISMYETKRALVYSV